MSMQEKTFDIGMGQQISLKELGISVRFVGVEEDSRCPQGVQCIWAGNVRVVLSLCASRAGEERATLNTMREPRAISYRGHQLRITTVRPPRIVNKSIKHEDYVITLAVSTEAKSEASGEASGTIDG